MVAIVHASPHDRQRTLLRAHPDLAGKLAAAEVLTPESTDEQSSAGLDRLTSDERARFTALNEAYKARFGIPFILAVKGLGKDEIVASFEQRLTSTPEQEFETALRQVEKITRLRLRELLPD
jgi:OHCU decarboxylase